MEKQQFQLSIAGLGIILAKMVVFLPIINYYGKVVMWSAMEISVRTFMTRFFERERIHFNMVRLMTVEDYGQVRALWMTIKGFAIRSIDDSREGVERFLRRNPTTSVVAVEDGSVVGAILCGHDGRRGCLYHVCVNPAYRRRGIGKAMVVFCMDALKKENINKVSLIAFTRNDVGNAFWHSVGWKQREDLNYYDFVLNDENIEAFNQ